MNILKKIKNKYNFSILKIKLKLLKYILTSKKIIVITDIIKESNVTLQFTQIGMDNNEVIYKLICFINELSYKNVLSKEIHDMTKPAKKE